MCENRRSSHREQYFMQHHSLRLTGCDIWSGVLCVHTGCADPNVVTLCVVTNARKWFICNDWNCAINDFWNIISLTEYYEDIKIFEPEIGPFALPERPRIIFVITHPLYEIKFCRCLHLTYLLNFSFLNYPAKKCDYFGLRFKSNSLLSSGKFQTIWLSWNKTPSSVVQRIMKYGQVETGLVQCWCIKIGLAKCVGGAYDGS